MSSIPPQRPRDEQQPSTSGTHRDPGKKSKKKRSGTKKEVLVPNTAHVACKCGQPFEQVSIGRSEEALVDRLSGSWSRIIPVDGWSVDG
ncbi:hypothetical protein ANCCAN_20347 [Ancylostoma caninum]|uniref:Uncharacterized protein n=1 Tax=Ancylostoma caninum TaxID=29170 RepID=A0A368FNM0_ANCCA|nr:hypothetical protein ANCCAN_20347 [Ancylostoma caninum]